MFKKRTSTTVQRQQGIAAVEFALFGLILAVLLTFPVIFSRYLMHYTVAQKAARDAAVYFSRLPLADLKSHDLTMAASALGNDMMAAQTPSLRPGGPNNTIDIYITCDNGPCGDGPPEFIEAHVRMRMYDDFFKKTTTRLIGKDGIRLRGSARMRYIGQ